MGLASALWVSAQTPAPSPGAEGKALAAAAEAGPRILGADLFSASLTQPRASEVRMGPDYLIGSGDQLALTTFGSLALSRVLTVDRGGKVTLPDVGIVAVGGRTLAEARAAVKAFLARRHGGVEQFDLEVVALHDVQVFVIGEVPRPGSYLVPGSSSAVTLLGLAGGPGPGGSWRSIQHLRGGKVLRTLDLYGLRFQGRGLQGPAFQDGDCLFVPLAGTRIVARGAFKRSTEPPGVQVELKAGEHAAEAVAFAGDLLASASRILLTVQRTSPEGLTAVTDLPNDPGALGRTPLYDGDVLRALPRREALEEYVEIAGAAGVPGRFAFRTGMRVHDLLSLRTPGDQVLPRTYRPRAELLRTLPDGSTRMLTFAVDGALRGDPAQDPPLQPRDRVELTDVAELRPPRRVTVLGPLERPGAYDWHDGMRASDLLRKAGLPRPGASPHEAELVRMRSGGPSEVRRLDLARLLATEEGAPPGGGDEAVDPGLEPFDRLTVYEDPAFRLQPTVHISGQVRRPGPYVLTGEPSTLRQLIERAGGLTPEAMAAGGVLLRAQAAAPEGAGPVGWGSVPAGGEPGPEAFNQVLSRLNETLRAKDSAALEASPLLHGLVAGSLQRLVVDFPAALGGDARQDAALQDGDRVHIPRRTDSVIVVGEVASPYATFHVKPGDRVRDVLRLAGGYTRNADVAQLRLLKASGRILDAGVERAPMEPGDALLVPQRIRKDVPWQESLMAMTPLAVLYNALRR